MFTKNNEVNENDRKFYEELSNLMSKANDLQNYLKINEREQRVEIKKKKTDNFIKQFINFGKIKASSNEQLDFRLYNTAYLNKFVLENTRYCTNMENKLVKLVIHKIKNKENLNDNEIVKINDSTIDEKIFSGSNKMNLKKTVFLDEDSNILIKDTFNNFLKNYINEKPDDTNFDKENKDNKKGNGFDGINKNFINYNQFKNNKSNKNNIQNKNEIFNQGIIDNLAGNNFYNNNYNNEDHKINNETNNNIEYNYFKINNKDNDNYFNLEEDVNNNVNVNKVKNEYHMLTNNKILDKNLDDTNSNLSKYSTDVSLAENIINKNNNYLQKNNTNQNNNIFSFKPFSTLDKKTYELYNIIFKSSFYNINSFIKDKFLNDKKWLNSITTTVESIIKKTENESMNEISLLQLITLSCILYPFTSINHKLILSEIKSKNKYIMNLMKYLNKNLLYKLNDEIKNSKNIANAADLLQNFSKDRKLKSKLQEHITNLKLKPNEEGKVILFTLYKYLIINRIFSFGNINNKNQLKKSFNDLYTEEDSYFLAFKIHFVLYYQQFYTAVSNDIIEVYEGLYLIKKFYTEIFCERNINRNILKIFEYKKEKNCFLFGKNKIPLTMDKNITFELDLLFEKKDNQIFNAVMNKIKHFFHFDENNINELLDYSKMKIGNKKFNFIIDLVHLHFNKNFYISQNFNEYKKNLINIENTIYTYSASLLINDISKNSIYKYSSKQNIKSIFNRLQKLLEDNLDKQFKNKYNLYPFGSVTEFVSRRKTDMDIYLDCSQLKEKERISFIYNVRNILLRLNNNNINTQSFPTISARVCVMTFDFMDISIDLSIMGFGPYIHSLLIREYSLLESRFAMLTVTLKNFVASLGLKNNQEFLNSYSWVCLLIAFLQDIISPPILPKLFSYEEKSVINKTVEFGNNNKKGNYFYSKNIESFINNIRKENILLPDCIFNRDKIKEIYEKQIGNNKNKLSCAEIFLSFLEFVIFYFKKDSTFVNCSLGTEGYESMSNIVNLPENEDFQGYFCNKYLKCTDYNTKKKAKDGVILIRDPVDPHYNPGQSLKQSNYEKFIEKIKEGYYVLLKTGNFYNLNSK